MSASPFPPHLKALVANSSRFTMRNIRDGLLRIGIRSIVEARDGSQAVTALGESKPDLLIVDWDLPGITAPEIVASARDGKRSHAPTMPVLVTMAAPTKKAVQQAASLRTDSILSVPFSHRDLRLRLTQIVSAMPAGEAGLIQNDSLAGASSPR